MGLNKIPTGRLNLALAFPSKWFPTRLHSLLPPISRSRVNGMWSLCGLFTPLEWLCRSHRRPGVVMFLSKTESLAKS